MTEAPLGVGVEEEVDPVGVDVEEAEVVEEDFKVVAKLVKHISTLRERKIDLTCWVQRMGTQGSPFMGLCCVHEWSAVRKAACKTVMAVYSASALQRLEYGTLIGIIESASEAGDHIDSSLRYLVRGKKDRTRKHMMLLGEERGLDYSRQ